MINSKWFLQVPGVSKQRDCICVDSSLEKSWTLSASHIDLHLQTQKGGSTPALMKRHVVIWEVKVEHTVGSKSKRRPVKILVFWFG